MVDVDMAQNLNQMKKRTVHKNVTIPVVLADAAREQGLNFSEVLTDALEEKLHSITNRR
ncbi:hypothetical protein FD12_GL000149 [Lentilactobacillus rapi DSM 19907 = JCM 15042]|uniref:Antitoxin n=2 Tax=Lentilactobacillus rapi TaxID=481723 RepID=A0A512PN40_9LACO|nr:type II toxin-antitoxin system CcdA family antitoxin [Lentilactobacillus rapi]KRL16238.1 hypothetical protein FD12_GL000149 [Lentilactobacillus rapi DSM 19907 = JCM 15042]GEP72617.1 hypothetical protein LRA02_14850 [Lentilactobacillus rapi]